VAVVVVVVVVVVFGTDISITCLARDLFYYHWVFLCHNRVLYVQDSLKQMFVICIVSCLETVF